MTTQSPKDISPKITQLVLGGCVLVLGIALILFFWQSVVVLFKGAVGIALALAGLVILFLAKK